MLLYSHRVPRCRSNAGAPPSPQPLDLGVTFSSTVTEALFGTGTAILTGLKGDIYALRPRTTEGFPGFTERVEWFAIVYAGKLYVTEPGKYRWASRWTPITTARATGRRIHTNETEVLRLD